jgi:superkiller protein 3
MEDVRPPLHMQSYIHRAQVTEALSLVLPKSPYYDLLATLPEPQPTQPTGSSVYEIQQMIHDSLPVITEILASTETDEAKAIKSEIDRRRMRLTSGSAAETRQAVQREVMGKSRLPGVCYASPSPGSLCKRSRTELYREVLSHPSASDEIRRETESKLLHYLHTLLCALPSPFATAESILTEAAQEQRAKEQRKAGKAKETLRADLEELARGMVLLKLPNELAWRIALDWTDVASAGASN